MIARGLLSDRRLWGTDDDPFLVKTRQMAGPRIAMKRRRIDEVKEAAVTASPLPVAAAMAHPSLHIRLAGMPMG